MHSAARFAKSIQQQEPSPMSIITDHLSEQTDTSDIAKLVSLVDGDMPVSVVTTQDGRTFAARRNDFALDNLTIPHAQKIEQPKWVTQAVVVQQQASLRDYVKRFKNDGTLLFADIMANSIVGAIDYHRAPVEDAAGEGNPSPRLGTHNVTLNLPFSEEWKRWTGKNESLMDQIEFADFLEENAMDVTDPTGASLLELCRDLHASQGSNFRSAIRMGDVVHIQVESEKNATTSDGLELPTEFTISVPVYFGEPNIKLTCLMRRKVGHGELQLGYKIVRAEKERQSEFQRIVEAVSVDTDTLAVYGKK